MSQPDYGQPDPQAAYGQQPSYGYQAPAEHPQAQMVFILGIVGIFVTIVPFIAWYLGGPAKTEIAARAPYPAERKFKTGYILGKVIGILQIVGIVLAIAIYAIMIPLLLAQGNF